MNSLIHVVAASMVLATAFDATHLRKEGTMSQGEQVVVNKSHTAARADTDETAIRPFTYKASDAELAELRRRVLATRWPDKETVTDPTQGVQLATVQSLAHYWATDYDWRKVE